MIPLKILNKKYQIKSIDELSTVEFINLSKIEKPDTLKYIAWQTGTTYDNAFFAVISPVVEKAIGMIPDITKLDFCKQFDKNDTINTIGQRHQIESSKVTGYELLVLTLAVSQAKSNNYDDVNRLISKYMEMSFKDILPSGFFFFKIYSSGKKRGLIYSLWQMALIKIESLRSRRDRKN